MTPLFKKLNFKDQQTILILNAPESFQENITAMSDFAGFSFDSNELEEIEFAMVFATQQVQINDAVEALYPKLKGDAITWFCYPKKSSKKYKCDFNRDTGWEVMGKYGMEGVRMVAIDQDWSALRFRKVEFIKTMKRRESFALSKEGKAKAEQKGK